MKRPLILMLLLASGLFARSQEDVPPIRSVVSSTMLAVGSADVLDTYLSPLDYGGLHLGLSNERMQVAAFGKGHWVKRQWASVEFSFNDNRTKNGGVTTGFLSYRWGALRRFFPAAGLSLMVGPYGGADAGFIYNVRNGNNPADAKLSVEAGAMATAIYRLSVWQKFPITLRYSASLPVVSTFFSPHYEQSYYEIFSLGNTKGIVRCGTWANRFDMDNLLTADLPLGSMSLRLGYQNRIHNTNTNQIKTRRVSNSFIIGFVKEFAPLSARKPELKTRRIDSAYATH